MAMKLKLVVVISTALFSVGVAYAQESAKKDEDFTDLSLEELVKIKIPTLTGASKYAQKSTRAPSAVSVITSDEIKQFGYTTLSDILRGVRGLYVTNNRNYHFLGIRGFSRPGDFNSRVLVLIDGHRINDGIFNQGSIDGVFPLDVDLIDRVEIIRGPGSSLYGTGAFFGVINVISKRGKDINGAEISAGYSSFATKRGRISYGQAFENGVDLTLSASSLASEGDTHLFIPDLAADPSKNNGFADHSDSERWRDFYGSLHYGGFTLTAVDGKRKKHYGTGLYDTVFADPTNATTDGNQYVDLQYERSLSEQTSLFGKLYYHHYRYESPGIFNGTTSVINQDKAQSEWWGGELRFLTSLGTQHRLTVGAENVDYYKNAQSNVDVAPAFVYLDANNPYRTWALFAQDEWSIGEKWTINLGVRYDDLDNGINSTNPRLGVIFNPTADTTIKLLYGTAFRSPNAFELYYQSPSQASNTNLRPEKISTAELVLEHNLTANLRGSASLYQYRIKDLVTQSVDSSGNTFYDNVGKINATGFELELEGKWSKLQSRISYSYQRAKDQQTVLSNSPRQLAKLNLIAPLYADKLSLGFEAQYVAARLGDKRTGDTARVPGYGIANVTLLQRNWLKGLEISAGVYNLFDKAFGDPTSSDDDPVINAIPQDGRTYRLKLSYKF